MAFKNLAVYAFSGDPITYGHIDIIERALTLFPHIIVAIGTNPDKHYTFSLKERERLAKEALAHLSGVKVRHFTGLLVDFAYEQKARAIIKGVRDAQDFAYEQTLHSMSVSQNYGIETVVLFAKPALAHISSSTVKMLQKSQGLTHEYVPLNVKVALEKRLNNQTIIGMTGEIASGKTTAAQHLTEVARAKDHTVHHIDLDILAHHIQNELNEPQYKAVRAEIVRTFGTDVRNKNGSINRKKLGEKVFSDPLQLEQLNTIMWKPVLVRLRRELIGKEGIVLIVSALLAEAELLAICNNRIILVSAEPAVQRKRLKARGFTPAQINRRLRSQYSTVKKRTLITKAIAKTHFGKKWEITGKTDFTQFARQLLGEVL